jgi:hypothetical protein
VERSADDTGLVITTYEGTHTHVSPATGSRGASDAPLLPASGEHQPGGAAFQPAATGGPSTVITPLASRVKFEGKDVTQTDAGPLRPTPSVSRVDPSRLLTEPPSDAWTSNTTEHLMKDLQDAMCWRSLPSHHAQEIHPLLPTTSPSPACSLSEGLLEDIVRHRHH